jgi:hypothetical protein
MLSQLFLITISRLFHYIYEFLVHMGAKNTAQAFTNEVTIENKTIQRVAINQFSI